MCLSMLQPPDSSPIPLQYFQNASSLNRHGIGYMFVSGEKLIVKKPFWKCEEAYDSYLKDKLNNPKSHFGIHFRLATHGLINTDNCHPHIVKPNRWAFIHNGVLPMNDSFSMKSDSALFAEKLSEFSDAELSAIDANKYVKEIIGNYSSIVLMSPNHLFILNEADGHWDSGVWYSNSCYKRSYSRWII